MEMHIQNTNARNSSSSECLKAKRQLQMRSSQTSSPSLEQSTGWLIIQQQPRPECDDHIMITSRFYAQQLQTGRLYKRLQADGQSGYSCR